MSHAENEPPDERQKDREREREREREKGGKKMKNITQMQPEDMAAKVRSAPWKLREVGACHTLKRKKRQRGMFASVHPYPHTHTRKPGAV